MGKATIISEQGEGRYTIQPEWDTAAAQTRIANLTAENTVIDIRLGTINTEISDAEFDYNYASDVLNAAIINQVPEADIETKQRDVLAKQAEWQGLKQTRSFLQLRKVANTKQIEFIEEMTAAPAEVLAWCADYTEGATGVVGTIEIGRRDTQPIIKPGGGDATGAAFIELTDGQLAPLMSGSPSATFYNLAMLPGAAKWKPRFRIGTVSNINTTLDTMTVNLDALVISNVVCNQETTMTGVPVVYMTCNSRAFDNSDRVLVEFGADWSDATVVGFAEGPKPCDLFPGAFNILTSTTNVAVYDDEMGWLFLDPAPPAGGGLQNWSDGRRLLCWDAGVDRYTSSGAHTQVFRNGESWSSPPPGRTFRGSALKNEAGNEYHIACCDGETTSQRIIIRRLIDKQNHAVNPGWYDAISNPLGWQIVSTVLPPSGAANIGAAYLFSPDATKALTRLFVSVPGVQKWAVINTATGAVSDVPTLGNNEFSYSRIMTPLLPYGPLNWSTFPPVANRQYGCSDNDLFTADRSHIDFADFDINNNIVTAHTSIQDSYARGFEIKTGRVSGESPPVIVNATTLTVNREVTSEYNYGAITFLDTGVGAISGYYNVEGGVAGGAASFSWNAIRHHVIGADLRYGFLALQKITYHRTVSASDIGGETSTGTKIDFIVYANSIKIVDVQDTNPGLAVEQIAPEDGLSWVILHSYRSPWGPQVLFPRDHRPDDFYYVDDPNTIESDRTYRGWYQTDGVINIHDAELDNTQTTIYETQTHPYTAEWEADIIRPRNLKIPVLTGSAASFGAHRTDHWVLSVTSMDSEPGYIAGSTVLPADRPYKSINSSPAGVAVPAAPAEFFSSVFPI